jgi:hypothetical protein
MRKVFVSYSRHNLEAATQLVDDLQAVGINTWHDQTLTGGQRWWDNILDSIRSCDVFIFALSKESWESEACRSELAYVVQLGKPILPVLVSDDIRLSLISAPLNEIQVTDYRRRDKGAAFALFKAINSSPAAPPLPDPLPAPPPVPVSYLGTLKERICSPDSLSGDEQNLLFVEIEGAIAKGRSREEIRDLLLSMQQRPDLLASVNRKVEEALRGLGHHRVPERPPDQEMVPAEPTCASCRKPVNPSWQFCQSCGAPVQPGGGPAGKPGSIPGSKTRRYPCRSDDIPRLITEVRGWLNSQDFETQQVNTDNDSVLLQIKKRGSWRDYVGMATSLNIVFHTCEDDSLLVEIGAGKWIDKAAVGTVSLFILWPLAITAGVGAWEQMKMPDNIFEYVGSRLPYRQ